MRAGDSAVRPQGQIQKGVMTTMMESRAEPEPEALEAWNDETVEVLITAAVTPFRTVQHPTVAGQMRRLEFWREIGRLRKARDLPALRSVLAEFEAWMTVEQAQAAEFWARERERITAREHAHILSGALLPEGGIVGGLDFLAGYAEPFDPPKRDE